MKRKDDLIEEQKLLDAIRKAGEDQDRKRAAEWAAREDRIKQKMSMMADTVLKKQDEEGKMMERKQRMYEEMKNSEADKEA